MPTWRVTKPAERTKTISRNMVLHAEISCQHGGYKASRKDTDNIQEYGAPCRNIMPTRRVQSQQKEHRQYPGICCSMQEIMPTWRVQSQQKGHRQYPRIWCSMQEHHANMEGNNASRKDTDNIQEYVAPCRNTMPTQRATMP